MALTKPEVLDLFIQHVDKDVIAQRMKQMYEVLTVGQQNAIYSLIKGDLVDVLTTVRDQLQARDADVGTALASANTELDDINAA